MLDTLIAIMLFLLSILPQFSFTERLTTDLRSKIKVNGNKEEIPQKTKAPESLSYEKISIRSKAALFIDANSGEVLYEKNKDVRLPMASTTKLMTAIIAVEKLNIDKVITVRPFKTMPFDSVMGLSEGDKLTAKELLHGLLISSGADASLALSQEISGDDNKFTALMNEKASYLGLTDTQFTNSVGYDDQNHYSTAEDLVKLSRIALLNSEIKEIITKRNYVAKSQSGKEYYLVSTNKLLSDPAYKGIKTGTTWAAGECLISLFDDGEKKIIGVVLGSEDRFGDTADIIDWAKKGFIWP